jgi:chaperonin cofactor prefoldin
MNNYEELIVKIDMLQQEITFLKFQKQNLENELENLKKTYATSHHPDRNKISCHGTCRSTK